MRIPFTLAVLLSLCLPAFGASSGIKISALPQTNSSP